jgi:hypothetical protein
MSAAGCGCSAASGDLAPAVMAEFERGDRVFYVPASRGFQRVIPVVFIKATSKRYTIEILTARGTLRRIAVLPSAYALERGIGRAAKKWQSPVARVRASPRPR